MTCSLEHRAKYRIPIICYFKYYSRIKTKLNNTNNNVVKNYINKEDEVVFIVRTANSVKSWRISENKQIGLKTFYDTYVATLCRTSVENEEIYVSASTRSNKFLNYELKVQTLNDSRTMLRPGKPEKNVRLSPRHQQLFQFTFVDGDDDTYLLKVNSTDSNPYCSLVSVQPLDNCNHEVISYI